MAALLPLAAISACDQAPPEPEQSAGADLPGKGVDTSKKGEPMPAMQLLDPSDEPAALAAEGGRPVLVNLWASWCAPCVKELPTLDALSKRESAPRVVIVAQEAAPRTSVDAFLASHGISNLESWRDPEMALSGELGVQVMPTTILYDGSGREVWRYVGDLDWTGEEAARLLAQAGAGKG